MVIPNKVYHYAALRKCILTKDTVGIREAFDHMDSAYLCSNDPSSIAESILSLRMDEGIRTRIGRGGFDLVTKNYSHRHIGAKFLELAGKLCKKG